MPPDLHVPSVLRRFPVRDGVRLSFLVLLLGGSGIGAPRAAPGIEQVIGLSDGEIAVTGSAFGTACARCELLADYGAGWRYALPVSTWTDTRIIAHLPDLNAGLDVTLRVQGATGISDPVRARVQRIRLPGKELRRPVHGAVLGLRVFHVRSNLKVGASGEETYDVSASPARCGAQALLFEEALLVFERQRFAQAAIVSAPAAGCSTCAPLRVRWYQEPTGHLELQVHIYHRRVDGICPQRQRP